MQIVTILHLNLQPEEAWGKMFINWTHNMSPISNIAPQTSGQSCVGL